MIKRRLFSLGSGLVLVVLGAFLLLQASLSHATNTDGTPISITTPPITPILSPPVYPTTSVRSPEGIPALHPTKPGQMPAFTTSDAENFALSHPLPFSIGGTQVTQAQAIFMSSQEISKHLKGTSIDRPDGTLLCYVAVTGTLIFPGPISTAQPGKESITYSHGFEVFDAATGNLLLDGGLP